MPTSWCPMARATAAASRARRFRPASSRSWPRRKANGAPRWLFHPNIFLRRWLHRACILPRRATSFCPMVAYFPALSSRLHFPSTSFSLIFPSFLFFFFSGCQVGAKASGKAVPRARPDACRSPSGGGQKSRVFLAAGQEKHRLPHRGQRVRSKVIVLLVPFLVSLARGVHRIRMTCATCSFAMAGLTDGLFGASRCVCVGGGWGGWGVECCLRCRLLPRPRPV